MKTALISVIIPAYKVEQYLPECLDSVINQTFQDWQAICVNDGSPDNCGKILDEYAKKDSRFITIHKKNGGLSSARNAAYEYINTPYVMFLDSDDLLHNQALELAYENIEKEKADMLWFDITTFNDGDVVEQNVISKNNKIKLYNNPFKFYVLKSIFTGSRKTRMPGVVWNKIYKSEYVKKTPYAPGISPGEDTLFTTEISAKIKKLVHLSENLYFYRIRSGSIMRSIENDKLKENIRKEVDWYLRICERLIEQNVSVDIINSYKEYLVNRIFFKRIFRPFIKKHKTSQTKAYVDNLINSDMFDFNIMKLRYRIAMFLYKHNQVKLSKLISSI